MASINNNLLRDPMLPSTSSGRVEKLRTMFEGFSMCASTRINPKLETLFKHVAPQDSEANQKVVSQLNQVFRNTKLIKKLGKGSYAKVYLIEKDGKQIALKFHLKQTEKANRITAERFGGEAIGAFFNHPNILKTISLITCSPNNEVHVTDEITIEKLSKLLGHKIIGTLTEYFKSRDLFEILKNLEEEESDLSLAYVQEITRKIALGLEKFHKKNIIHRDIKPENILVSEKNEVKIVDFGLMRLTESDKSKVYTYCGTPKFIAPEVHIGKPYSEKNDCFAFGTLLFMLIFNDLPWGMDLELPDLQDLMLDFYESDLPLSQFFHESIPYTPAMKKILGLPNVLSLIDKLTFPKPEKRISISEALNHPFFSDHYINNQD